MNAFEGIIVGNREKTDAFLGNIIKDESYAKAKEKG